MSAPTTTAPAWTKAEAKAADAELARLSDIAYAASDDVQRQLGYLFNYAGSKTAYVRRGRGNSAFQSFDGGKTHASLDQVREILAGTREVDARRVQLDKVAAAMARYEEAVATSVAAVWAVRDHDAANYRGWGRFFLVPDGHIHSSTGCHSLRPTTRIGWLPELSGETEAEAVALHGAMLCTHCFPSAPVEWTDGRKADDDQYCAGGGTWDYPRETARTGYCAGNYGVCSHCGEKITVSSTGKMRKHKKPV